MRICVHGLGYVGLASASLFANNGHDVVGYDTDEEVVARLRNGNLDIPEADLEQYVGRALSDGLSVSDEVVAADYHVICVPTPYEDGPELGYLEDAATGIASQLRPGDVVVVESTVPPTTTAGTVAPLLERSGLVAVEEFKLAYAPETILPGNTVEELRTNDRIIGGIDDDSARQVGNLFAAAIDGRIHIAPDATTAEFVKLAQNAFRDVNIAFANEMALVADDYGVDVRESIRLANTHPRVDVLSPGPGVGGHCLPVDPLFLTEKSERTKLVERARAVNDGMPGYIMDRLEEELGSLAGRRIAVLGIAYKGNVEETRNSPGLALAAALRTATLESTPLTDGGDNVGTATVALADPHVSESSLELSPVYEALRSADAAVLTAAHDEFAALDPARVAGLLRGDLVFDAVDVLDASTWEQHGLDVVDL
jgi:nucleotide sugar dehydrogenase